jgi:hypothetical protein
MVFLHPTNHDVVPPTAGKATCLLQSAHVLYHRRYHHRLYHAIYDLPAKPKRYDPTKQHTCDPAVIDKSPNNPTKTRKADSKESAFLTDSNNNDRATDISLREATEQIGSY